jgi:phosphoglycerate kinase
MNKKSISDISVAGKTVLVRVDFNVPLDGKGPNDAITVTDDTRILAALPTLNHLLAGGAGLILCSHLGRPSSAEDRQFSMGPVADRLGELLGKPIIQMDEVVGEKVSAAAQRLQPGQVMLLENTRFEPGEKKNDMGLASELADLADVFVNDAFGSAHRAHASTEGVARAMQAKGSPAVAGFLMEAELKALGTAVDTPPQPLGMDRPHRAVRQRDVGAGAARGDGRRPARRR